MQINGKELCENCFRELTHGSCDYCTKKIKEIKRALPVGTVLFDRFVVGKPIDEGRTAISYYGYDQAQNRRVLLKEYFPSEISERAEDKITVSVIDDDAFGGGLERFFSEARALSNFKKCDGIIKIYKFFNENGTSYYVTELLDGYDLEKYLKKLSRSIPETAAVKIILKTLDALSDVHAAEPCHGQLSPRNIFLCSNGTVKLSDVGGLSSVPGEYASVYAPIERKIRNYGRAGAATDVYSIGAIMYEMITGKTVPDPISRLENDTLDLNLVSDQLCPVIRKMLEILPKNRYQSISELRVALNGRLTIKATPTVASENPASDEPVSKKETEDLSTETSQANTSNTKTFEDIPRVVHNSPSEEHSDSQEDTYDEDQFFCETEALPSEEDYSEEQSEDRAVKRTRKEKQRLLSVLYSLLGVLSALLILVLFLLLK